MRNFDRNERNGCLPLLALSGLVVGSILLLGSLPYLLMPLAFLLSFCFCSILVNMHPSRSAATTARSMLFSVLWASLIMIFLLYANADNERSWFRYPALCFISGLPAYWLYFFITKGRPIKESLIRLSQRPKKSVENHEKLKG